jgi:hypothetical protein
MISSSLAFFSQFLGKLNSESESERNVSMVIHSSSFFLLFCVCVFATFFKQIENLWKSFQQKKTRERESEIFLFFFIWKFSILYLCRIFFSVVDTVHIHTYICSYYLIYCRYRNINLYLNVNAFKNKIYVCVCLCLFFDFICKVFQLYVFVLVAILVAQFSADLSCSFICCFFP